MFARLIERACSLPCVAHMKNLNYLGLPDGSPRGKVDARVPKATRSGASIAAFVVKWAALALCTGCMTSPVNGQAVVIHAVDFDGFAENPGALIEIHARNWRTNTFVSVATTRSSTAGTTLAGDTLYAWSLPDLDLHDNVSNPRDYWLYEPLAVGNNWVAEFKAREVGSRAPNLATFEDPQCVVDRIQQHGESWIQAGAACTSSASPVVRVKQLTFCIVENCPANP